MGEPARTLPFKQVEPPQPPQRWNIGIDRQRVAVYVGLGIIAGFGLGFATARYMALNTSPPKNARSQSEMTTTVQGESTATIARGAGELRKVTRVIRADTIEVEGLGPVRMIGVETPDGKSPDNVYGKQGRNAVAFVEQSMRDQEVRVDLDASNEARHHKDDAGRLLGYVYTRDGKLFNSEMIEQGHAFVRTAESFRLIDEFRGSERNAMQAMRGVWGLSDPSAVTATLPASQTNPGSSDPKSRKLTALNPSELEPKIQTPVLPAPGSEPPVYVSSSDRMYHRDGCEYLGKKKQLMAASQAKGEGYVACSRCFASTVLKAR